MEQKQPQKAKLDVWTKLQTERSDAMLKQEENELSQKIQDILAHAPKEIDTPDGKFPYWQFQYNRARQSLGYVSYHQEVKTKRETFWAQAVTDKDLLALPYYDDIVFLIRDGETAQKFRYEGKRAAAAWERLKESYKVFCSLPALDSIKDADARAKAQAEQTALHEFYGDTHSMVLQAIHDDIEEYQRSLIAAHEADDDFLVRITNSIKMCAAILAGESKAILHTMMGNHSGPKMFDRGTDVDKMTSEEREDFYTVLFAQANLFTFAKVNNRFMYENNRSFGGMQVYLSYVEGKDEALYKELSQWKKRLLKNSTWSSVHSKDAIKEWRKRRTKEQETPKAKQKEKSSASADDAQPPEGELADKIEERVRNYLMKPSSQPLRAMKGTLGSGLDADRLKDRIEESSHTSMLTKLDDATIFGAVFETREKGKRKNGTAVVIDEMGKKFSTLQQQAPNALDYLDFFTTYAMDNVIAGGELIRDEIVIPYDDFLTKNGGFCNSKEILCKAIGRYGPILMSLMLAGEYKPIKKNGATERLTEHDFIHPFRRITNKDGFVRVLLEPEFNWGLLFRYRYQIPTYFWQLEKPLSRRILDRALETARIAGGEHRRERSEKLRKEHVFEISLSSALRDTNIPTPEQTGHPRRDIIEPVVDAVQNIMQQEQCESEKCLKIELVADDTNANTFLRGHLVLHVYGEFAERLLAQSKRSIERRKTNARKAEKRKENVEYRLAKNAAKNQ